MQLGIKVSGACVAGLSVYDGGNEIFSDDAGSEANGEAQTICSIGSNIFDKGKYLSCSSQPQ